MAAALVATGVLAAALLRSEYEQFRRGAESVAAVRAFAKSLRAMEKISVERGPTNANFAADAQTGPVWRERLGKAREETDAAFAALDAEIAASPAPDAAGTLARIRDVRGRLASAREAADALAARPAGARDPAEIRAIVARLVTLALDLAPAADATEAVVNRANPELSDLALVARMAAETREFAGQLGSVFSAPLARRVALIEGEILGIERLQGHIAALAGQLSRAVASGARPDIAAAHERMRALYFDGALGLIAELTRVGRGSGDYPVAAGEFVERYVAAMRSIFDVRDAALEALAERAAGAFRQSREALDRAGMLAALVVLMVAGVWIYLRRRIVSPLAELGAAAADLAGGVRRDIAQGARADEIGELARSLQAVGAAMEENARLRSEQAVAARRHAEQRAFLDATFDHMDQGVLLLDDEWRPVAWNGRFHDMIGLPSGSVRRGMPMVEILEMQIKAGSFANADDPRRWVAEIRAGKATLSPFSERRMADGRWIEVRTTRTPSGMYVRTYTDATERKAFEEALASGKSVLDATFESMSQAIIVTDAAKKAVAWNRNFQTYLDLPDGLLRPGITLDEIARHQLAHGEFKGREEEIMGRILLSGRESLPATDTYVRQRPNGHWLEVRTDRMPNGGYVRVVTDISAHKRIETELRAAKEEADAAAAAKSTFLATMSHEIRTPMNGVLGLTELLRQTELDGEQREMTAQIDRSARALLAILDDVLDFSKIEAGRLSFDFEPFDLGDEIEAVAELLGPGARSKGIEVDCFVDPRLPERVLGDATRIRQILVNLAGNAVKFTESGRISMALRVRSLRDGSVEFQIDVSDTGIGISQAARKTLFQPFQQAEDSPRRRFGGTGLGLSISRRLVEGMGGTIGVDSQPGRGSTFWFRLHLESSPAPLDSRRVDLAGREAWLADLPEPVRTPVAAYLEAAGVVVRDLAPGASAPADACVIADDRAPSPPAHGRVVLLVRDDAARRRVRLRRECAAAVSRPPKRASLLHSVGIALGLASPEALAVQETADAIVLSPFAGDPQAARAAGWTVLVAEDQETNRSLIERQLARLGYACDLAEDGVIALEAWRNGRHAAVLTDIHMPRMDGIELAQRIRAEEKASLGRGRTPIVALTANAIGGEERRCRDAGIDDFLVKPAGLARLGRVLAAFMPSTGGIAPPAAAPARGPAGARALDLSSLADILGDDDPGLIREVVAEFVEKFPRALEAFKAAIAAGAAEDIAAGAHAAKGAAAGVGAEDLRALCAAIEQAARRGDVPPPETAARLDGEFARIRAFLESYGDGSVR